MPIGITPLDDTQDVWTQRRLALLQQAQRRLSGISSKSTANDKSAPQSERFISGSNQKLGLGADIPTAPKPGATPVGANAAAQLSGNISSAQAAKANASPVSVAGGTGKYAGGSTGGSLEANDLDQYGSGYFFSDYPQVSLGEIVNDPEKAAYIYGGYRNKQGQTMIADMLGNIADPEAMMLAMGYQSPFDNSPAQLAKTQQLWDKMLGRGSGPNTYMDPGQLLANVLREVQGMGDMTTSKQGSVLQGRIGSTIGNPRATAEAVNNTIAAALYGFMPNNSYAALMSQLDRARMEYDDMLMREPTGRVPNYAQFLQSKLGMNLNVGIGS